MKCLSISELHRLFSEKSMSTDSGDLKKHLNRCAKCRKFFNNYLAIRAQIIKYKTNSSDFRPTDNCFSPEVLMDYLDNNISKMERYKIQTHIAECNMCLDELVLLSEFINDISVTEQQVHHKPYKKLYRLPQIARDIWTYGCRWRIATIAIAIFFISTLVFNINKSQHLITRDKIISTSELNIENLFPAENEIVNGGDLELKWSKPQNVSSFLVILLNDEGEIIMEEQTNTTNLKIPDSIILIPGQNYFWQVSAKFPDGQVVDSRMSKFTYKSQ